MNALVEQQAPGLAIVEWQLEGRGLNDGLLALNITEFLDEGRSPVTIARLRILTQNNRIQESHWVLTFGASLEIKLSPG